MLDAHRILDDATPYEACMIVVPSPRLRSGRIALLLRKNGVRCRPLGHGTGTLRDSRGTESRIRGLMILAVDRSDVKRLHMYAKLFGVSAILLTERSEMAK